MPSIQFKYTVGETVYVSEEHGGCCKHTPIYKNHIVESFMYMFGKNYYDIGLDEMVEEKYLYSVSEMRVDKKANMAKEIDCIEEKIESLGG